MNRFKRKFNKINKFARIVFLLLSFAYLTSFVFFSKSVIALTGIETVIRYIILILFLVYLVFYLCESLVWLLSKKYLKYYLLSLLTILIIAIFVVCSLFIDTIYEKISNMSEKNEVYYVSNLISLKNNSFNKNSTIGMISDENDIEGNILAKEIINDNKLKGKVKKYDSYVDMIYDLYEENIDGVFVSGNYVTLFSNEQKFENIKSDTKVEYTKSRKMNNIDSVLSSNKSLDKPFTILVLGVDSESEGLNANAAFNGDTLILVTFNPDTLSATIFSIPRDTYVPIACRNNRLAKINSSAAYGTSCVIDTIEALTDISIDYYLKINFKGVVDLVEAIKGVEVYVQEPDYEYNHGFYCGGKVCEQDSNRIWDYPIYIDPGLQTLNGEQALAYARCRGVYAMSDLARNVHQQDIITAIGKKIIKVRSYSEFKKIFDAVSNNMATNMSTDQMLSSYQILKNIIIKALNGSELVNIQRASLETYNLPVYLASSNTTTSALSYYDSSLKDITKAMKVNLELEKSENIKTFSYDINEEYEATVAGKGIRSGATNSVLPSFIQKAKADAENYCNSNNYTCSFKYVDENSTYYNENIETDLIVNQNPHQGTLTSEVSTITFYINGASVKDNPKELLD